MDWANERYVRLYTRDTGDWALWPWETRSLFCLILRKVDRTGVISCGKGRLRALAKVIDMPEEEIVTAIEPLLEDGCIQFNEEGDLIVVNFIEAQEVLSTPAARQRDSRERRRDMVRRGLRPEQRECAIYFIQPENGGSIKIGRAEDVAKRLVQLQTSRPDKLVVIAAAPGTYEDERRLHEAFAPHRDRGEWFCSTEGLVNLACHVNETGHIPSDLSRFVTSHSDLIRAIPIQSEPSSAEPDTDTPAAPVREEPQSQTRIKSVPPPPPEPSAGRVAIALQIRSHALFKNLDAHGLAPMLEMRAEQAMKRTEWILTAIDDCAVKFVGRGLKDDALQSKLVEFCNRAGAPLAEKPHPGEAKSSPAHKDFAFEPGELGPARARKRVTAQDGPAVPLATITRDVTALLGPIARGPSQPLTEAERDAKRLADKQRLREQDEAAERKAGAG